MSKVDTTFFELALKSNALLLGDFTLKSGKKSPYFFNIGSFFSEGHIEGLAALYSEIILNGEFEFDVIFGPAYKGIPLAAAVSTSLSMKTSRPIPFAFDRKEEKSHGEGGNIVGEVKDKKVLILDDVLTAGTALKQSMEIISNAGGKITGCMVALDREEIFDQITARDKISKEFDLEITSIARISQLIDFFDLSGRKDEAKVIRNYLSNL
jgi:orotate phosphoribosyltransferase|tara:strand:- start:723 stop:1352 length:630 start_codon:yes stop_codon:yes gene_type:complete